ncbi:MAG: hypothetical protein ACXWZP_02440 [Gaiellaceae bacterium]
MAPLTQLAPELVAHGGIPGLIAETSVSVLVAVVLGVVWWRERRRRGGGGRPPARMRDP